ncbi:MAG TPA: fibronectin type III domain-containing protein [Myxococcaceae bacterium]|nr:fibronectin type III domain-containing protein [Myxococcaceae bacterium]
MSRRSTPALFGLVAALTLVGCTDRTVDIDFVRSFHLEGAEPAVVPVMPSHANIQAWGLAGGAFRGIELLNRGTFIQGVEAPEPPYWYGFGGEWIFTPEAAVTWGVIAWGRPDISATPPDTSLSLQVSGLVPWLQEADRSHSLVAWGSGAGYLMPLGADGVESASESAELKLTDLTLEDHGLIIRLPAYKGEAGDSLHVLQFLDGPVTTPEGEERFTNDRSRTVVRAAKLKDGLDLPSIVETSRERELTADVALSEGTLQTLDVDVRGDGFDAVIAEAGGVLNENAYTRVMVRPDLLGGYALERDQNHPYVVSASFQTPEEGGPTHARFSWSDAGQFSVPSHVVFARSYEVNGVALEAGVVLPLEGATELNAAPLVGAPGPIRIDGEEVGEGFHVTASSPVISWSAPTVGTATGYEVRITRRTENVGSVSEILHTTETQLRLPPVFMGGEHKEDQTFVVTVLARNDASEGYPDRVQAPKVPYGFAARATPVFTAGSR